MFTPLNENEIEQIVRLQTDSVVRMLKENNINMTVTEEAIHFISQAGFDPEFGARPIKRAIQKYLLNDLSKQILAGNVAKDSTITVTATDSGLEFQN